MWAVVSTLMNLQVSLISGDSLTSWGTIGFYKELVCNIKAILNISLLDPIRSPLQMNLPLKAVLKQGKYATGREPFIKPATGIQVD
jgi:hypothetical protein